MFKYLGIMSFLSALVMLIITINPKWISREKPIKRKHTLLTALIMFILFATFAINDTSVNSKPTISPSTSTTTNLLKDEESKPQQNDTNKLVSQPNSEQSPAPVKDTTPAVSQSSAPTPTVSSTPAPTQTAPPTVTPAPAPKQTPQAVTVYITKTGKKYHRDGCRYLSQSKIPISLSNAQNQGYGPCSVCNPPQ